MRKIALVNQKGGCGKTTTAVNLASFLADLGRKVLLIDMDPQGHCALGFGIRPESVTRSTHEVLTGVVSVADAAQPVHENLDAVFSNVVLSGFEQLMAGVANREYRLREALSSSSLPYDYVVVDSPPSVGLLTFNTLMASDEALVPVDSSANSIHGLDGLVDSIDLLRSSANHSIRLTILPTHMAPRTKFGQWVLQTLLEKYPDHCTATIITSSTCLREAARHGQPLTRYGGKGRAWNEYRDLAMEILQAEKLPSIPLERRNERTVGPLPVLGGMRQVTLSLESPPGTPVKVAGDFNDWKPEDLVPARSGDRTVWKKVITLPPGTYKYKYVVAGRWIPDPFNQRVSEDLYGGYNSVLNV